MAHMLEFGDNGVAKMIWTGDVPWHGEGLNLGQRPVTSAEVIAALGVTPVEKMQSYFKNPNNPAEFREAPGHYLTVRMGDLKAVGRVGSHFTVLQDLDVLSVLDSLGSEIRYKSAGYLRDGACVFITASINDSVFEVVPGHVIEGFLGVSNWHDASSTSHLFGGDTAVVCDNTRVAAIRAAEGSGRLIGIRHTGDVKAKFETAAKLLGYAKQKFEQNCQAYQQLASKQMPPPRWSLFLDHLAPLPTLEQNAQDVIFEGGVPVVVDAADAAERKTINVLKIRTKLSDLFENGVGMDIPGVRGTAWGALNAVTEYTSHRRQMRGKDKDFRRVESNMFGQGAELSQKAFDYLVAA